LHIEAAFKFDDIVHTTGSVEKQPNTKATDDLFFDFNTPHFESKVEHAAGKM
jgi:hypothetical protein